MLKSDSHHPKKCVLFVSLQPFKTDEKWFLFHLKSSFRSQDIKFLPLYFGQIEKTAWFER